MQLDYDGNNKLTRKSICRLLGPVWPTIIIKQYFYNNFDMQTNK